ncbi:MAG: hypothetical protein WDW38_003960 [Sanguina aurantia]
MSAAAAPEDEQTAAIRDTKVCEGSAEHVNEEQDLLADALPWFTQLPHLTRVTVTTDDCSSTIAGIALEGLPNLTALSLTARRLPEEDSYERHSDTHRFNSLKIGGLWAVLQPLQQTLQRLHMENYKGSVSLLGGGSVSKLSLIGLQSPFNFTDFTALRELYYDTACMYPSKGTEILDLSSCEMLQETLQCDSFAALSKMDLTACAALKVLSCAGSGLKSLDLSDSPLLAYLDVSGSSSLREVFIDNSLGLLEVVHEGCPRLCVYD